MTFRRTEDGSVTASQDTHIKVISLNEPLPPDTFSPKGIDFLKPGTPVMWALNRDRPVPRGELVWDGNEVVAAGEFALANIMAESSRFRHVSMFFILFGIALILFSIGWKLWRKYET